MITLAMARSVARAAITRAKVQRTAHAVVIRRGEAEIHRMLAAYYHRLPTAWCVPNGQLVGVYDARANFEDVAADILAAEAGEYARPAAQAGR